MFEIGSSLREARTRQDLDFPQIEAATKIRGKYLRALEDESFTQLPAQTYVKGFLRTYAEYLGLDGQLYVDEFNSRYVATEEDPPIRVRRDVRPRRRHRMQSNVLIAALVGIALVTALVIAAWKSGSPARENVVGLGPPPSRVVKPSGPPSITFVAKRTVFLTIRKSGPTGKVLFDGSLGKGEFEHYTTKRLWVQASAPENVKLTVRGAKVRLLGGAPRVFYVTARGVSEA
jgi:hypothetical protein